MNYFYYTVTTTAGDKYIVMFGNQSSGDVYHIKLNKP